MLSIIASAVPHILRIFGIEILLESFSTTSIYRLDGYIPIKYFEEFESKLQEKFGTTITLLKEEAYDAPILKSNPFLIDAFETLTRLGALPRYNTIDATPFTFILFPLFWGLMVGDIAYGIIILFAAFYLQKRFENESMKAIAKIFMVSCNPLVFPNIIRLSSV